MRFPRRRGYSLPAAVDCAMVAGAALLLFTAEAAFAQQQRRTQPQPLTAEQVQKQVPPGVKWIPDIAYREGNEAWRLDLAMPEERGKARRPGIVIVHGGGWRGGDKRISHWWQLPLEYAGQGYVAISINYRLSGEAPFPACVEDVKCAVRWFRANADKYNVDPSRIGGFGASAGAHLVAMLGLAGPEAGLEGDGPYQDKSSLLEAVFASATPTDFLNWGGNPAVTRRSETGLLAGPEDSFVERARKASPITYVRADAPPFVLIHGTEDRTVPISQAERFVKALREAGAEKVTYMIFDGAGHGVFSSHSVFARSSMMAFFDSTIGAKAAGKAPK